MVGYLEAIDSERGIAWRCADSNSLKLFLGYAIDQSTLDHSTLSRTRRLIDLQTHAEGFRFLLKVLTNHDLIGGRTVGVDSTTLEANAAMRSIVRRDSGERVRRIPHASGQRIRHRDAHARRPGQTR